VIADAVSEFWNVHWIWLAVPIALVVAVVYKTTKIDKPVLLVLQSLKLFAYILVGMGAVGALLYYLPDLWPGPTVP
jgi:hypothetical protein